MIFRASAALFLLALAFFMSVARADAAPGVQLANFSPPPPIAQGRAPGESTCIYQYSFLLNQTFARLAQPILGPRVPHGFAGAPLLLRFNLRRDGHVMWSQIEQASAAPALDQDALALNESIIYPPFNPCIHAARLTFTMPVFY